MKTIAATFLAFSLSFYGYCQNNKFITPNYVVNFQLQEAKADSIWVSVSFENISKDCAFILNSCTTTWSVDKTEIRILFGEALIDSRDSSQELIKVMPGSTKIFHMRVPNYLNDSSIVYLIGGFVNVQTFEKKDAYERRDFPRGQDYRYFRYSFLALCK